MALSKSEKAELNGLFARRQEAEGCLLMVKERARGKSKHMGETDLLAQLVNARVKQIQDRIRTLTAKR